MITVGFITVQDFTGHQQTCVIDDVLSLEHVADIANFFEQHGELEIISYAYKQEVFVYAPEAVESGPYDRIEQHLVLTFRDGDTGDMLYFSLPAPRETELDDKQQPTQEFISHVKTLFFNTTPHKDIYFRTGGLTSTLPE